MRFFGYKYHLFFAGLCLLLLLAVTYQYSSDQFIAIRNEGGLWGIFYIPYIFSHVPLLSMVSLLAIAFILSFPYWREHWPGAFLGVVTLQLLLFLIEMRKEAISIDVLRGSGIAFLYLDVYFMTATVATWFSTYVLIEHISKQFSNLSKNCFIIFLAGGLCGISGYLTFVFVALNLYKKFFLCVIVLITILYLRSKNSIKQRVSVFLSLHGEKCFLAAIFMMAFILRAGWGMHVLAQVGENFIIASDDGPTHHALAKSMVENGIFEEKFGARYFGGYGYWLFLSLIYKICGVGNFVAVVISQAFLNAFLPVCVFFISKQLTGVYAAMLSALLVAISSNLLFNSTLLAMESIFIPLIYLCILFSLRIFHRDEIKSFLVLGFLLGIAFFVRNEVVLLCGSIVICSVALAFKTKHTLKPLLRNIVMVGAIAICASIQIIHNYYQYGDVCFLTNGQLAASYGAPDRMSDENVKLAQMGFNPFRDKKKALDIFLMNKKEVTTLIFKGLAKKIPIYLFFPNFGYLDTFYVLNPWVNRHPFPAYARFYVIICVFIGFFVLMSLYRGEKFLPIFLVGSYFLLTILFYAFIFVQRSARYHGVVMPIIYILFSTGLVYLVKSFKQCLKLEDGKKKR